MDRKLTDHEKEEYRKQFGPPQQHKAPKNPNSIYPSIAKWLVILLFLALPQLLDIDNRYFTSANTSETTNQYISDEARLQVYAARTWGPKGIFAVHSWIAMKRPGGEPFEVSQVIGWRQQASGNVVFRETNVPINSWWGKEATLLLDLHGEEATALVNKVDSAISNYPWQYEYQLYPGPNSNTFVSWIGLQVPELGLDLPSTAIGKDWRPFENALGSSASGTGLQASLFGMLGTSVGLEEGLEVNVLGLNFELDVFDLAIEIPLFGRYEVGYLICFLLTWVLVKRWARRTKSRDFSTP